MWHKLWNGSTWSNWQGLGGNCKDGLAVASKGPNQLDCYAIGFNNDLIHTSWNGSVWSGWESLGGNWLQAPAAVSLAGKRIDTFLIGTDKALYHQWFS